MYVIHAPRAMLGPPPDPPGPHLSMWQHGVCAWHHELCAGCPVGCVALRARPVRPTRDAATATRAARGASPSADRAETPVSGLRETRLEDRIVTTKSALTFDIRYFEVLLSHVGPGCVARGSPAQASLSAAAAHLQSLLGSRHSSNVRGFNVSQPHSSHDGAQCRTAQLRGASGRPSRP